eukprot:CAMPEP_0119298610 /NCGR_PEP_ID=MMETSP1333-20130426/768_1 /TAXON_ID=418940 /ORGANISM="Scyphosphaera apsteinii, Strain RCC1455" /LENGTH=56 /DNA_ID=CAMNT_0007299761 /DNA_START=80 /DNA_END=250 /DNA_ORIENTATION=+
MMLIESKVVGSFMAFAVSHPSPAHRLVALLNYSCESHQHEGKWNGGMWHGSSELSA